MGGGAHSWRRWVAAGAAAAVLLLCGDRRAAAYSAAGDRLFPAMLQLPQITPGDEFYVWANTLPLTPHGAASPSRTTGVAAVWAKTLTERLGIVIEENWTRLDRVRRSTWSGMQNLDTEIKYLAVIDQPHEFLLTLGVDREFGGTGATRVGAAASGATAPQLYFGKGLGDLDIGRLRPLAIAGVVGYQVADDKPRPDLARLGLALEYSVPYLRSKVESIDLPDWLAGMTPITELWMTTPAGKSFGARTTALFAPGFSYAGIGWELGLEMMIPATRATGAGVGGMAQIHLSLDYLAAETIGRPLFSAP